MASTGGDGIDPSVVRDIVAACLRAPSGDNCQPWRFTWNRSSLIIHHDEERARHPINRGDYGSLLALGCVVESAAIRASAHGLGACIAYGDLNDHAEPWATVALARDPAVARDPLASAIDERCTDRRPYHGGELDDGLRSGLASDAVGTARVHALPVAAIDGETMAYLRRAESSLLSDPRAFAAVMEWVRFNQRESQATRDGMPVSSLGVRSFEVPVLRLLRACPWLVRPVAVCGSQAMQRRTMGGRIRSAAGLVCMSVTSPGRPAVVDAGRAAMRAWLRLTAIGFGVQPLSLSSLYPYLATHTDLMEPTVAAFHRAGGALLARAFGLPAGEVPVWMFRTGRCERLPDTMRTLRRTVDEVLELPKS